MRSTQAQTFLDVDPPKGQFYRVKVAHELPELFFRTRSEWNRWLSANGTSSSGVWLRLAKRDSGIASLSYQDALERALCHGWVDGQKKSLDDEFWLQRFTPRGPRSIWSKLNRKKAADLMASGQMTPAGLAAVQSAQADGRWQRAYESQHSARVPADLAAALRANPGAQRFFAALDSRNRYAILFRLHQAVKAETRRRRLSKFVAMLAMGGKIYP